MFVGCKGDANCWKRDKTNDDLSGTFVESCRKSPLFRAISARFIYILKAIRQIPS